MSAMSHAFIAQSEFVLGGQKSGKSRRAEELARTWLAQSPQHRAVLIATAQPWDDEMCARITRHQQDRAERVPGLLTLEEPRDLAGALAQHARADTLVVIDCLTMWLTNWLMPMEEPIEESGEELKKKVPVPPSYLAQRALFLEAIENTPGPVVVVGNEIGLGVIPLGREVRAFVDALGTLNQAVAQACSRVTLMAAGLPMTLKDAA
jgi:adenosylcobinamide kinase/adenosylcobinamide-phosphate guanylyltransferase